MKKFVLYLIIIISCFIVSGCEIDTVGGNKDFGKYTGIYKLNDSELRIAHNKNTVLIIINQKGKLYGNSIAFLKKNKSSVLDCEFEFKDNEVILNTKKKDVKKGTYKRVGSYSTKQIYEEYIGDIKYLNNDYNGIYENDNKTIYTIQTHDDVVRFATKYGENNMNINTSKKDNNHYAAKFFNDVYDFKFNGDKLETSFKSEREKTKSLTGKYTRKSKMNAVEAIKAFAFDGYAE